MTVRKMLCAMLLLVLVLCAGCTNMPSGKEKDTDNDGYSDKVDKFPNDPKEWKDTDGDGRGDNSDKFVANPGEWNDTDGDGHGDNSDKFPANRSEWNDTDGDGRGDNSDKFPANRSEWNDTDNDGVGDNGDAFPADPRDWKDTDGDGHGDQNDTFPLDPKEWNDADTDGTGDNADDFPFEPNWAASLATSSIGGYWYAEKYHVFGFVTNNKTKSVGGVNRGIHVRAIITGNGTFNKEMSDDIVRNVNVTLEPGCSMPFTFAIDDSSHLGTGYKVIVIASYFNSTPLTYVNATALNGAYNSSAGYYFANATTKNSGPTGSYNMVCYVAFYDGARNLQDIVKAQLSPSILGAGESGMLYIYFEGPRASSVDVGQSKVYFVYGNS